MRGSVWVDVYVDEKQVPEGKDISKVALPLTRTWWAGAPEI